MRIHEEEGILWDDFHPPYLNSHQIYNYRVNTQRTHTNTFKRPASPYKSLITSNLFY